MKFQVKAKLKYTDSSYETSLNLVVKYKTEKQLLYRSKVYNIASTWSTNTDEFLKEVNDFFKNLEENVRMRCIQLIQEDINYNQVINTFSELQTQIKNMKEFTFEIEIKE